MPSSDDLVDLRDICLQSADQKERLQKVKRLRAAVKCFCDHNQSAVQCSFVVSLVDVLIEAELAGGETFHIGWLREKIAELMD